MDMNPPVSNAAGGEAYWRFNQH